MQQVYSTLFANLLHWHSTNAGIELRWEGEGIDEKGIDAKTGKVLVAVSEDFYRLRMLSTYGVILRKLRMNWDGIRNPPPLKSW